MDDLKVVGAITSAAAATGTGSVTSLQLLLQLLEFLEFWGLPQLQQ